MFLVINIFTKLPLLTFSPNILCLCYAFYAVDLNVHTEFYVPCIQCNTYNTYNHCTQIYTFAGIYNNQNIHQTLIPCLSEMLLSIHEDGQYHMHGY